MDIVLIGPGALGCLLASRLAGCDGNQHHRFTLLDHDATRATQLSSSGIQYEFGGEERKTLVAVRASASDAGSADVVINCVKSYDIAASLTLCRPLLGPITLLIFMQNGIAHLELHDHIGEATPAYATTTEGATRLGPGRVRHAGRGLTQFGFLAPVAAGAKTSLGCTVELFNNAGFTAQITDDILSRLWTKLLINVGINGLTALLDCPNGELLALPSACERMERLVGEACRVAERAGIEVPASALELTREVCVKTAANISSMLQDVHARRRTEIDAINGAVAAEGKRLGVATPENDRLVRQIKELERTYL